MKKLALVFIIVFAFVQILNAKHYVEIKKIVVTDTLKVAGIDPVCKMKLKAENTKTVVFEKVTYRFCSESCKKSFVANPKKYIKK